MSLTPNLLPKTGVKIVKLNKTTNQGFNSAQTTQTVYEGLALINQNRSNKNINLAEKYGVEQNNLCFLYLGTEDNTIFSTDIPGLQVFFDESQIGQNTLLTNMSSPTLLHYQVKDIETHIVGNNLVDNKKLILTLI